MTSQEIDREIREQLFREITEALRPLRKAARHLREVYTPGPFGDSLKDEGADAE